jgi:hypothetical protein
MSGRMALNIYCKPKNNGGTNKNCPRCLSLRTWICYFCVCYLFFSFVTTGFYFGRSSTHSSRFTLKTIDSPYVENTYIVHVLDSPRQMIITDKSMLHKEYSSAKRGVGSLSFRVYRTVGLAVVSIISIQAWAYNFQKIKVIHVNKIFRFRFIVFLESRPRPWYLFYFFLYAKKTKRLPKNQAIRSA